MMEIEKVVFDFLNCHYSSHSPLLLALSGGPDSLALLHVLLAYRQKNPMTLGIIHIDHGWREESKEEAEKLQKLAESLGLPFHLKRIIEKKPKGSNLEDFARSERLSFFKATCLHHGYVALLTAHHADDQAETVLKRVLEGASLPALKGISPVERSHGFEIWRPFLSLSKKEIEKWLKKHELEGFFDKTNEDTKFLRAKFRKEILPDLSKKFGKNIHFGLTKIGEEARELKEYLEERLAEPLKGVVKGPLGVYLDLAQNGFLHPFEMKYLLKAFCLQVNFSPSIDTLETILSLIRGKTANKQVAQGQKILYIDRGKIFCPLPLSVPFSNPLLESEGNLRSGPWSATLSPYKGENLQKLGWMEAWKGEVQVALPFGQYSLKGFSSNVPYHTHSSLAKWWSDAKVPFFLRNRVPVLWKNNGPFYEFLTGKIPPIGAQSPELLLRLKCSGSKEPY